MNAIVEAERAAIVPAMRAESATLTQAIIAAANDPTVNIEKMERLLSMHERISARDAEQQFNAAMVDAQSRMGRVSADAVNPQTRSQYATYAQIDRALRPIYTASGFSLSFNTGNDGPADHVRVLCYVSHASGHTRTYACDMPSDGKGAKGNDVMTKTHATGAAMSYGMRYMLKLIFNVAIGEDDTDGNAPGATSTIPEDLLQAARDAAMGGWKSFAAWVKARTDRERELLAPESDNLKRAAKAADQGGANVAP